ncbi:Hypothetical predicted protein [Xyrichtys novacula]|uniref:Uncharacterized protein n=1 Tax=Xyrichtys novacula TaxID=13765 RepID=A0AAV1F4T4_XYRNO|nr:Hypothetical predicted protein [Xyrichtys novacula]
MILQPENTEYTFIGEIWISPVSRMNPVDMNRSSFNTRLLSDEERAESREWRFQVVFLSGSQDTTPPALRLQEHHITPALLRAQTHTDDGAHLCLDRRSKSAPLPPPLPPPSPEAVGSLVSGFMDVFYCHLCYFEESWT